MTFHNDSVKFISFVIPARNEENYIKDCIEPIRSQGIDLPYEIIVIDNVSRDKTSEVARKCGVRVVVEKKVGLPYARQRGLEEARGDILFYVDADTRLKPGVVTKILEHFQKDSRVVAVSPGGTYFDGSTMYNTFVLMVQHLLWPVVRVLYMFLKKPQPLFGNLIAVRKKALVNAGGINFDYQFYGEDVVLAQLLYTQGKTVFDPSIQVTTSWRRFRKVGLLRTAWRYVFIYVLMMTGRSLKARQFSKQYAYEADVTRS